VGTVIAVFEYEDPQPVKVVATRAPQNTANKRVRELILRGRDEGEGVTAFSIILGMEELLWFRFRGIVVLLY
jgi:hypothetical protein